MAETVEVLNAKVVVDASSVTQAQSQFNAAVDSMAAKSRGSFSDMAAQVDKNLNAKFKELDTQIGKTEKEIGKLSTTTRAASESARSFGQQVRSAFLEIGTAAATIAGPVMLAVGAFSAMQEAAEFRGMAQATRNMANSFGVDMARIMRALDEASNSTLTAQDKFRLMNEAMLAGGSEVADKLPQLVEIARAAAIASGVQFETVFQKLLLGIARGSAKLIDDARIYIRIGNVVEEYAKSMGIATEAVDAQIRTRLILNAVLEDGDKIVQAVGKDTLAEADAFKQVTKASTELIAVLKGIPEAAGAVTGLANAFQAAAQWAILAAAGAAGLQAGIGAVISGRTEQEQYQAAEDAKNRMLKRLLPAVGITGTGTADDPRERARRKILEQELSFADQEAAAEEERLARLKTMRDKEADLIISGGEKVIDARENMLQDMEELEIDHQRKLEDIALDGIRKRQDIEIDYGRKVEDAGLEYQRAIEDQQRESDNRRIEIEQRYQERLRQIQRKFQDSYWEAVKNRDAVALVEAVRDRNRGIEDAGRQRDIDLANEERQREESRNNAWLSYQRKLQDAERYYRDAMYDQQLAEQRAIDDESRNHQYREAEIKRHYQWRLDEIGRWLDAEIMQARDKYAQMQADASAHYAAMAAIVQQALGYGGEEGSAYYIKKKWRRAEGGLDIVTSPTDFTVGEAGPEMMLTVPLGGGQQMLPAPMSHLVSGDVRHQVDMITASGMRGMEGRIIAAVMQAMREVYRR